MMANVELVWQVCGSNVDSNTTGDEALTPLAAKL